MKRRKFLKFSVVGGVLVGSGFGLVWLQDKADFDQLTIEHALALLEQMKSQKIISFGQWSPAQIFTHVAQSIDYSMSGYPQQHSAVFKNTVGRLAFQVFSIKGKMRHGLSTPIPGAATLDKEIDVETALQKLILSLNRFTEYQGKLEPHFAYGELSKEGYALAHIMHLNNHFEEIRFQ